MQQTQMDLSLPALALSQDWPWIAGAGLLSLLLLMVLRRRPGWRELRWRRRLRRILRRGSLAMRSRLELPDGLDGSVLVDHLLLTPQGLVLVDVRAYTGALFAAQDVDQWAQIVGGRSFRFPNPIRELENRLTSVRLRAGEDIPLRGLMVFPDEADFPKGRPDCVVRLAELRQLVPPLRRESVDAELQQLWSRVLDPTPVVDNDTSRPGLG